jgi:hypothetical protein
MKKAVFLFFLISFTFNFCQSQEWMNSLDVAKRLALVQDKMLFVVWENTTLDTFPVILDNGKGGVISRDLFEDNDINQVVWEYFIPVIIKESNYEALFNKIKDKRDAVYIDKFNDNSIKIMDANGNILNTNSLEYGYGVTDLTFLLDNYALRTTYLKQELANYSKKKTLSTVYNLASKYLDFSIHVNTSIRTEVIDLAHFYLEEAIEILKNDSTSNKSALEQKCELLKLNHHLIVNRPKKALRLLKKFKGIEIEKINQYLFSYLHYTAYKLLKDEEKAMTWKLKVLNTDLNKANLILKINL